ncbi:MAG: hypothetical protein AB7I41_18350 [Candidatus Sericytochromatia bacterium]
MFINNKSLGTNGLDPMSILKKKPAGTVEGAPKNPESQGASQAPKEKLEVAKTPGGSSQPVFSSDDEETMKNNWLELGKTGGAPIKSISEAIKNKQSSTAAVLDYMKAKGYSKEEIANVGEFIKKVSTYESKDNKGGEIDFKDPKTGSVTKRKLLDVLVEGLKTKGINDQQLKTLANDGFSFNAYTSLVKDGHFIT